MKKLRKRKQATYEKKKNYNNKNEKGKERVWVEERMKGKMKMMNRKKVTMALRKRKGRQGDEENDVR